MSRARAGTRRTSKRTYTTFSRKEKVTRERAEARHAPYGKGYTPYFGKGGKADGKGDGGKNGGDGKGKGKGFQGVCKDTIKHDALQRIRT